MMCLICQGGQYRRVTHPPRLVLTSGLVAPFCVDPDAFLAASPASRKPVFCPFTGVVGCLSYLAGTKRERALARDPGLKMETWASLRLDWEEERVVLTRPPEATGKKNGSCFARHPHPNARDVGHPVYSQNLGRSVWEEKRVALPHDTHIPKPGMWGTRFTYIPTRGMWGTRRFHNRLFSLS